MIGAPGGPPFLIGKRVAAIKSYSLKDSKKEGWKYGLLSNAIHSSSVKVQKTFDCFQLHLLHFPLFKLDFITPKMALYKILYFNFLVLEVFRGRNLPMRLKYLEYRHSS